MWLVGRAELMRDLPLFYLDADKDFRCRVWLYKSKLLRVHRSMRNPLAYNILRTTSWPTQLVVLLPRLEQQKCHLRQRLFQVAKLFPP